MIFQKYEDFTMCVIVICGASMLIIIFIPESPHWFIVNGKRDEFLATMREAAIHNRIQEPLTNLELLVPLPEPKVEEEKLSLWGPLLFRPTISLIFSWTSLATIYYGNLAILILLTLIRLFQELTLVSRPTWIRWRTNTI